jgi:hypothetical protein
MNTLLEMEVTCVEFVSNLDELQGTNSTYVELHAYYMLSIKCKKRDAGTISQASLPFPQAHFHNEGVVPYNIRF